MKTGLCALILSSFALGCHSSKKAVSDVSSLLDDTSIAMVGEHKLPMEETIPRDSVNFFAIKTKNPDLFATQSAIVEALKASETPNRYRTLVPGTYKAKLEKGEYLVLGWHQHYKFQENPGVNSFMEFMIKLEDGEAMESAVYSGFGPATQSDFAYQPNPRNMPQDGVMPDRIDLSNFKYSVSGNEVTLLFPAYVDGRTFN
jgi:hypothetical protein